MAGLTVPGQRSFRLNPAEKRRAEALVDGLIHGMADRRVWEAGILGIVKRDQPSYNGNGFAERG